MDPRWLFVRHADGAGGLGPRGERVGRARGESRRRQTRSGRRRGRPRAGEAGARARHQRDARTLRRHDSTTSGWGAERTRSTKVGGSSRRRGNGVESRRDPRRERPGGTRCAATPQDVEGRAANAALDARAHRRRSHPRAVRLARAAIQRPRRLRSPETARKPGPARRCSDPPAGSRISFRRPQISRISAPRRAPRLRGCTARRPGSPRAATRAGGAAGPRRGVDREGAGQPVRTDVGGPFLLGRGSRSGIRHAGPRRPSSNRGVRPGLHLPSARGSAPESAKPHGGRGEACQRSAGSRAGSPSLRGVKAQSSRVAAGSEPMLAMPRAIPSSEVARVKNEGVCEVPSARTRGFSQGATRRRRCRP